MYRQIILCISNLTSILDAESANEIQRRLSFELYKAGSDLDSLDVTAEDMSRIFLTDILLDMLRSGNYHSSSCILSPTGELLKTLLFQCVEYAHEHNQITAAQKQQWIELVNIY